MYAAPRVAEEWTLEMNSEREGSTLAIRILSFEILSFEESFAGFDRVRQSVKRPQSHIDWSGDGGWKITRDAMPREQLFDRRQCLGRVVHDVVSGAAVKVKIDVTRRHHAIAEVGNSNSGGNLPVAPAGNFEDTSLLDEHEGMLEGVRRSQQPSSSKKQHRNFAKVVLSCDSRI